MEDGRKRTKLCIKGEKQHLKRKSWEYSRFDERQESWFKWILSKISKMKWKSRHITGNYKDNIHLNSSSRVNTDYLQKKMAKPIDFSVTQMKARKWVSSKGRKKIVIKLVIYSQWNYLSHKHWENLQPKDSHLRNFFKMYFKEKEVS